MIDGSRIHRKFGCKRVCRSAVDPYMMRPLPHTNLVGKPPRFRIKQDEVGRAATAIFCRWREPDARRARGVSVRRLRQVPSAAHRERRRAAARGSTRHAHVEPEVAQMRAWAL
jgi:hypothetical protein